MQHKPMSIDKLLAAISTRAKHALKCDELNNRHVFPNSPKKETKSKLE